MLLCEPYKVGLIVIKLGTIFDIFNKFLILFQGASASFPSFYCDIKQDQLKNHGKEAHNFQTVQCKERRFDELKIKFTEQVECPIRPSDWSSGYLQA